MIKKMLLGNDSLRFAVTDLHLLIHGYEGYGASLFSVSVMADLYALCRY